MSAVGGASQVVKRKNFTTSEEEEVIRFLLAGSKDGILSKVEVVILGSFCCGEKHIVGGQLKKDRFWPKGFGSEKPIKKTVRKMTHMGSR